MLGVIQSPADESGIPMWRDLLEHFTWWNQEDMYLRLREAMETADPFPNWERHHHWMAEMASQLETATAEVKREIEASGLNASDESLRWDETQPGEDRPEGSGLGGRD